MWSCYHTWSQISMSSWLDGHHDGESWVTVIINHSQSWTVVDWTRWLTMNQLVEIHRISWRRNSTQESVRNPARKAGTALGTLWDGQRLMAMSKAISPGLITKFQQTSWPIWLVAYTIFDFPRIWDGWWLIFLKRGCNHQPAIICHCSQQWTRFYQI